MVASDRISTYDAVHPTPIPDKGRVLTGLSVLWFGLTRDIVPNHFVSATDGVPTELRGRAIPRGAHQRRSSGSSPFHTVSRMIGCACALGWI